MKVPILDLTVQDSPLRERVLARVASVAQSGRFVLGDAVGEFERRAAAELGARYAVGCSSGSDALVVALGALGVSPGDEVITTPFSFFATVESIVRVGARPRFVDVDPETLSLDPAAVSAAITKRTRALLGVHLYGSPGPAELWRRAADEHGIPLLEDAAQAFTARRDGRAAGTFGALGCFSFQPTKPLGAWGDAGLVVTDDEQLAARCLRLRSHGAAAKHLHQHIGGNFRLDTIQAAVLCEKLGNLPAWVAARNELALAYDQGLANLSSSLLTPKREQTALHISALYTVRVLNGLRDRLAEFLLAKGIETAVHYPLPLHRQQALLDLGLGLELGSLPAAERACGQVLSLPIYPELGFERLGYVVERVREFFAAGPRFD